MANAQNGARIKVFGGSPYANSTAGGGTGYVKVRCPCLMFIRGLV